MLSSPRQAPSSSCFLTSRFTARRSPFQNGRFFQSRFDSAIHIFDPSVELGAIKSHHYPRKHAAFRGEMMRFVMDTFRTSKGKPVTTREIAMNVAKGRGLREDDEELLMTLRKRVGACIFKLRKDGVLREVEGTGNLKLWALAQGALSSPLSTA